MAQKPEAIVILVGVAAAFVADQAAAIATARLAEDALPLIIAGAESSSTPSPPTRGCRGPGRRLGPRF